MPFSGYYLGSNLSDLGRNMVMDADSQRVNDRATQAQLMQAWQQQAEMQRLANQDRQFNAELAFRQQGQQQGNAYQNALLDLQKQQLNFGQTGMTAAQQAQDKYNYAALQNALDQTKLQYQFGNPQIGRETMIQNSTIDAENAASQAKADRYNQMYQAGMSGVDTEYPTTGFAAGARAVLPFIDSRPEQIKQQHNKVWAGLLDKLSQDADKTPIRVSADGKFEPVIKPKFTFNSPASQGQIAPGAAAAPATDSASSGATLRDLIAALQNQAAGASQTNRPGVTNSPSRASVMGYQAELNQLNAAAQSRAIDRSTYIQLRQALEQKYGVMPR